MIFMIIMIFKVNKKTRVKTDGAWVHMAQNNNNNNNNDHNNNNNNSTFVTANKEGEKMFD